MGRRAHLIRVVGLVLLFFAVAIGSLMGGVALDRRVLARFVPLPSMPKDAHGDFALIAEAWNAIDLNYVDRSAVERRTMAHGAISGLIEALGDTGHSVFLTPEMAKSLDQLVKSELVGIGVELQAKNGEAVIAAPLDGSPAQKAGLRPGDVIVAVDGHDVSGEPLSRIAARVAGPAGTKVTLSIHSSGTAESHQVTITRARVAIHNVRWEKVPGTRFAILRIAAFSGGVTRELKQALAGIQAAGLTAGLVLDLRDDPGGLLEEAVSSTSQFLAAGNVLLSRDAAGQVKPVPVELGGVAAQIPMVVLVNQGTASAAEICAGALQDARRAQLIGEKTFGTGTVLRPFPLSDGSLVVIAVEEWLTPGGRVIWHKGIAPDVTVTLAPRATPRFPDGSMDGVKNVCASGDAQLLRGLAVLAAATSAVRPCAEASGQAAAVLTPAPATAPPAILAR